MIVINELKAAIARQGLTEKDVAKALGMSSNTFCRRKKSGVFGSDEISLMIELLKIDDPMSIFFAKEVA